MPLFFVKWSWSFGATSSSFILLPLLKWTSMPYLLHIFFTLSLRPSSYETVMWPLLMVLLLLLLLFGFGVFIFNFVLFIAQLGYLHCNRAFCIRECSTSRSCWLEQRFFALCSRELMMLYLFDMAWWLSHCTYCWYEWVFCTLWWPGSHHFVVLLKCQTPSNVGVLPRIIFSHTPDEARSGGLAKACVPGKNYSRENRVTKKCHILSAPSNIVLFNISEQNRTYTTLESSVVLI